MRIRHVIAHAFGPFSEERLDLADGLTVVAGPNEAGKSSWHAATRLALTGLRRGRGRTTKEEAALADRHKPWDAPDRWEVEARLELDDGRTIDITQDLAGKVACRALDVGLGRDVSDEILDGTPDASRWLGLNRDAFEKTVSVSQAEIMAVADAADELQEQMQRAAATRGTDATAAQAIERLEGFRREAVGADTVVAKGPLRRARNRLEAARARLTDARTRHAAYLEETRRVEEAEEAVARAHHALALADAAVAHRRARRISDRVSRAAELSARHPAAPPDLSLRDAVADRVAAAITGWERRPTPVQLQGPSSEEITRELAGLPERPSGPLQPEPEDRALLHELDRAEEALALLGPEPAPPEPGAAGSSAGAERMRAVARRLGAPLPAGAETLEAELATAREAVASAGGRGMAWVTLGLVTIVGGLLGAMTLALLPGIVIAVAGLLVGGWGWRAGAAARTARHRAAAAEAALAPYRVAMERALAERAAAAEEARAAGWPEDPDRLAALADRAHEALRDAERAAERRAQRATVAERRETAARRLLEVLASRGIPGQPDPRSAWVAYEAACAERARQATAADRREPLQRALASRRAAEETAAGVERAIGEAAGALERVAAELGLPGDGEPDLLVDRLRAWQRERAAAVGERQVAIEEWRDLTSLLEGRTLEELRAEADARVREAAALARGLDADAITPLAARTDLDAVLTSRRAEASAVDRAANELRGGLEMLRNGLPVVAEAEEELDAATAELERVLALATTIDETLRLLGEAQERVHRDLAPVLASAVQRWLPIVSGGAYAEVSVDPANLAVRVKEAGSGAWREAALLSAGTREQIYLLLRVAMAQHLVSTGETAPLLLDEVTAQADPERRAGLLRVLREISHERQVVLFTHDEAVASWAERTLDGTRERLIRLASRTVRGAAPRDRAAPGTASDPTPAPDPVEPTSVRVPA